MQLKQFLPNKSWFGFTKPRILTLLFACLLILTFTAANLTSASSKPSESPIAPLVATNVLYVETNDPLGNAILMYRRNADGSISKDPAGVFPTKGKGFGNPKAVIGPQDGDTPLIASPDKKFLFAANMGSHDISVFNVKDDGTLTLVEGSPFPSGGKNPASLAFGKNKKAGQLLFVANKACSIDSPAGPHPSGEVPNYAVLSVSATGQLTLIPNSIKKLNVGANPAQIAVTPNAKIAFGNDLWGADSTTPVPAPLRPFLPQKVSYIRSYKVDKAGVPKENGSSPTLPPSPNVEQPFLLGMVLHPTQSFLYAALVGRNELAVYQYDSAGNLTFVRTTPSQGVGICWAVINKSAKFLYTTNTFDGTIESFDISDPSKPTKKFALLLREPGPSTPQQFPPFSSQPYQLALDPSDQFLYFVGQRSTTDLSFPGGNNIHVYKVNSDGTMVEPFAPVNTPVAPRTAELGTFIQGLVVF